MPSCRAHPRPAPGRGFGQATAAAAVYSAYSALAGEQVGMASAPGLPVPLGRSCLKYLLQMNPASLAPSFLTLELDVEFQM